MTKLSRVKLDPKKIYTPIELLEEAHEQRVFICLATIYNSMKRGTLPQNWVIIPKNKIRCLS